MNTKKSKEALKNEVLDNIKTVKTVLSKIDRFTAEENQYFQNENDKLSFQTQLNNKDAEEYLQQRRKNPQSPETIQLILDVLSQNIQSHHSRMNLHDNYVEDIYKRIRRLKDGFLPLLSTFEDYINLNEGEK